MSEPKLLEMKGIGKSFGGTRALNNVDLSLNKGEVIGLIGENGAGKSTLMKILCGAHGDYEGEIYLDGQKINIHSTSEADSHGIGIIYQELTVFPHLSIAQNIFIKHEEKKIGSSVPLSPLNDRDMRKKAHDILKDELGLDINTQMKVSELSLAQRQLVEIARCLIQKKKIVIMDEPTSALEGREREMLFEIIRKLKASGCSVIYISHYLEEILNICDKAMILKDGESQGTYPIDELDLSKIIEIMIGRSLEQQYPKEPAEIGEVVLKVENLNKGKDFRGINMELKAGEVIGIAGLASCGKNELVRSIMGITGYDSGNVYLKGKQVRFKNVQAAIKSKLAFIPAERKTEALFANQDVRWNTTIASMDQVKPAYINKRKEIEFTNHYINELSVKTSGFNQKMNDLSGGNQQKVVLGRWLMTQPDVIFMEEPTRGIDVNAKVDVYRLINKCAQNGKAVCVVSSENAELKGICDRIIVMHNGHLRANVKADEYTQEEITYFTQTKGDNEL